MNQPEESPGNEGTPPGLEPTEATLPDDEGAAFVKQRLRSLDAYRGLIMILLAFVGFGLFHVAVPGPHLFPEDLATRGLAVYDQDAPALHFPAL